MYITAFSPFLIYFATISGGVDTILANGTSEPPKSVNNATTKPEDPSTGTIIGKISSLERTIDNSFMKWSLLTA